MKLIDSGLIFDASSAQPNERCAFFPTVEECADGSLICGFSSATVKSGVDCHAILYRSQDAGNSWERLPGQIETTYEGIPGSILTAHPCEIAPGHLLASLCWVDRSNPELPFTNPETNGLLPVKYLITESTDGGASWSPTWEADLKPHPAATPTGPVMPLDDGRLMLIYEHWKNWLDEQVTQRACVRFSDDHGHTWGPPTIVASHPDQTIYYWDNRMARDPATGDIAVLYWTHDPAAGKDTPMHVAMGSADGQQWSEPVSMGIEGQIGAPCWLGGDSLLCFYVHRHDPTSMRAVISYDRGQTWDIEHEIVVYDHQMAQESGMSQAREIDDYWNDMKRWTFGHPGALMLASGQVLLSWYAGDGDSLSIYWAKLA